MIRAAAHLSPQLKDHDTFQSACGALVILAKPGIVSAATLSGFAGMVLGAGGLPEARTAGSCVASVLLMALGAALANSVLDRRMDQRMERLALRSAALKRIGAGPALVSAAILTCAALAIATAELNVRVVLLLLAASLSYVLGYTVLLKPYTHWAAVLGGLPGALPVLIGNHAVASAPDCASWALFLVLLLWQPPHFWLLAVIHLEEYRVAEVPVLPLTKGLDRTRQIICLCVLALIPASLLPWCVGPCSKVYALGALLLGCSFLFACRHFLYNGLDCRPVFRGSIAYLTLLLLLMVIDLTR
jgi:heme o synthase